MKRKRNGAMLLASFWLNAILLSATAAVRPETRGVAIPLAVAFGVLMIAVAVNYGDVR